MRPAPISSRPIFFRAACCCPKAGLRPSAQKRDSNGAIAGSTLTQDAALRLVVAGGLHLADAVAAVTAVPARAIGMAARHGSLRPGAAADAVLLDGALHVAGVWVDGTRI